MDKNLLTLVNNSYKNKQEIITSYLEWYLMLDDAEKELRVGAKEASLFASPETKELNMDVDFTMTIVLLSVIVELKKKCVQELTMYMYTQMVIESCGSFFNTLYTILQKNDPSSWPSVDVSELEEIKDSQVGGAPGKNVYSMIVSVMMLILFQCLLANANDMIALVPNGNIGVQMKLNIQQNPGQLSKVAKLETEFNIHELDTDNVEDFENFLNLFKQADTPYKKDKRIESGNLKEAYETSYNEEQMDIQKKMPKTFFEGILTTFSTETPNYPTFEDTMQAKVKELNKLIIEVNKSLQGMCTNVIQLRTENVPIELYRLFNEKLSKRQEEMEEIIQDKEREIREEVTEFVEEVMKEEGKEAPSSLSLYETITSYWYAQTPTNQVMIIGEGDELSESDKQFYKSEYNKELAERVNEEFSNQMNKTADEVLNNTLMEVVNEVNEENKNNIMTNNREVFFASFCDKLEPFKFNYDAETSTLSIDNNAKSMQYLSIIVKNILSFGEKEKERVEDPTQKDRVQSLMEKSNVILNQVIPAINSKLMNAVIKGTNMSPDLNDFTNKLVEALHNVQNTIYKTASNFPLKDEKVNQELLRIKENADIENKKRLEEQKIEEVMFLVDQNISKQEWDMYNQWMLGKIEGVLKVSGSTSEQLLNATEDGLHMLFSKTGNVLVDLGQTGANILNNGIGSILGALLWQAIPILSVLGGVLVFYILFPVLTATARLKARRINAITDNQPPTQNAVNLPAGWKISASGIPKPPEPSGIPEGYEMGPDGARRLKQGWTIGVDGRPRPPEPPGPRPYGGKKSVKNRKKRTWKGKRNMKSKRKNAKPKKNKSRSKRQKKTYKR